MDRRIGLMACWNSICSDVAPHGTSAKRKKEWEQRREVWQSGVINNISYTATAAAADACWVVMLRYIENIEMSIRYRYIVSYRIARGNIEIFDTDIDFLWCQEVVKFSLSESFSENFTTSWYHTWKFGKRITEFFIVRKFREILYYLLPTCQNF